MRYTVDQVASGEWVVVDTENREIVAKFRTQAEADTDAAARNSAPNPTRVWLFRKVRLNNNDEVNRALDQGFEPFSANEQYLMVRKLI